MLCFQTLAILSTQCHGLTTPGAPWRAAASWRHFPYTPSRAHTHSHPALHTFQRPLGTRKMKYIVSGPFPPNLNYFSSIYPLTSLKRKGIRKNKMISPQITRLPCPQPHEQPEWQGLCRERTRKLQTQGGRAEFSSEGRDEATDRGARGVSPACPPLTCGWSAVGWLAAAAAAAASLSVPGARGARGAPEHPARCGHLCRVARGRWDPRPGSWLRPTPCEATPAPGSRRESARQGRPRGTGAHWPGSPCPVPLSFPVARGGDARGGEEAVPAAPPPPPPPPAAPGSPAGPRGGGGQGASPVRR